MAIITVKEFAELCGKAPKDIHTYATRGKVIKHRSGGIDTNNVLNQIFLDKCGVSQTIPELPKPIKINPKPLCIEHEQTPEPEHEAPKEIKKKSRKQYPGEDSEQPERKFVSASELNDLKAEKLEQEILQLKLKNQRLEGELIEMELIKQATFEVINAYRTKNYQAAHNVMQTNMKDLGATNDQLVKATTDLTLLFNVACTEAIEDVKITIDKLI